MAVIVIRLVVGVVYCNSQYDRFWQVNHIAPCISLGSIGFSLQRQFIDNILCDSIALTAIVNNIWVSFLQTISYCMRVHL